MDNPPAFPPHAQSVLPDYMGMTLRDYFAGHALVGLLASNTWHNCGAGFEQYIAMHSHNIADAMLAERNKAMSTPMDKAPMHTPGPWSVFTDGPRPYGSAEISATVGDMPVTIGFVDIANAALIAAAPELLEALQWALDEVTTARQFHRGSALSAIDRKINDARAAIAKATKEHSNG